MLRKNNKDALNGRLYYFGLNAKVRKSSRIRFANVGQSPDDYARGKSKISCMESCTACKPSSKATSP